MDLSDDDITDLKKQLALKQKKLEQQKKHAIRRAQLKEKLKIINKDNSCTEKSEGFVNLGQTAKGNRFYPSYFMKDYVNRFGVVDFDLPDHQYGKLKLAKFDENIARERTTVIFNELISKDLFYSTKLCSLKINKTDPVLNCFFFDTNLIIVQEETLTDYVVQDVETNKWTVSNCMRRIKHDAVIGETAFYKSGREENGVVYLEIYKQKPMNSSGKIALNLVLYDLHLQSEKHVEECTLSSLEGDANGFVCCPIAHSNALAISAWAPIDAITYAWSFFLDNNEDGQIKQVDLLPVKDRVCTLHDLSGSFENSLLACGTKSLTIWNPRTGQKLRHCNVGDGLPFEIEVCHFATLQKGYLFIVVGAGRSLNLLATNLSTGLTKSLRHFDVEESTRCIGVSVAEERIYVGTELSWSGWSLKSGLKLGEVEFGKDFQSFVTGNRMCILPKTLTTNSLMLDFKP